MNLYAFRPAGHGPVSMFVVAESEQEARQAVTKHMQVQKAADPNAFYYDYQNGDLNAYELTVADCGVVVENANQ